MKHLSSDEAPLPLGITGNDGENVRSTFRCNVSAYQLIATVVMPTVADAQARLRADDQCWTHAQFVAAETTADAMTPWGKLDIKIEDMT